jgi:CelD/BcsL family acetyltransferase involved in cellulose biosynthesis
MQLPGPDAPAWDRLAAQSQNIFLTLDFAEAWWAAFRPRGRPMVLVDDVERPRCIVPLYSSGGPVPLVRQIGHGPADALGPICAPEDQALAAELIQEQLCRELRRGALVLHDTPADDDWAGRLGGTVVRTTPGPVVRLQTDSWPDYLASRSKNFREQVRRKRARLDRSFEVRLRVSDEQTLEEDVSTLLHLHRLRWGQDAPFASGKQAEVARRFARACLAAGRLRLSVLELDGRPAAAQIGLRFAAVHSFWQSGRDPEFESHSIGAVLLMDALRAAVEDGASEFRLLRGDEAYKQRLADAGRDTSTVAVAGGVVGGALIHSAKARRSARRRLSRYRHAGRTGSLVGTRSDRH